jgi:hypothetical protein
VVPSLKKYFFISKIKIFFLNMRDKHKKNLFKELERNGTNVKKRGKIKIEKGKE